MYLLITIQKHYYHTRVLLSANYNFHYNFGSFGFTVFPQFDPLAYIFQYRLAIMVEAGGRLLRDHQQVYKRVIPNFTLF